MSMRIEGVPESIPRQQVLDFLSSIGIDIDRVPIGGPVLIGRKAIRCRMLALDAAGKPFVDETGEDMATHDICIPIVEDRE